jgi:hypothetical protein
MTRLLFRVVLLLAFAVTLAGEHYKSLAEQNRKPGHHGADDPRFWPDWLEFYTPKGQFYLKLSRGLKFTAFVIVVWGFFL